MTDDLCARALYARGYIISSIDVSAKLSSIVQWEKVRIGGENGFFVFYDPRNEVIEVKDGDNWVFLLGVALDPDAKTLDKDYIAKQLIVRLHDDRAFLDYVDTLCGRYIIVYGDRDNAHLLQDACGMRSCYYGEGCIASHYNLIRDAVGGLEDHEYFRDFMEIPEAKRPWYMPGDITPVKGVRTLIPNHELNLKNYSLRRIFPRNQLSPISADEVGDYLADLIKTQLTVLAGRYGLLMSMTGGNDSRTVLSGLKELRDRTTLFSYLNNSKTDSCAYDNVVAKRLADAIGFKFVQLKLENPAPKRLREIADRGHFHEHITAAIPYFMTCLPSEKTHIHIRNNIFETIRNREFFLLRENTPKEMERQIFGSRGLGGNPVVIKAFEQFHRDNEYDKMFAYDPSDIWFMEVRMGLWHTSCLIRQDIAFDVYCVFNQRRLLDYGMRMPNLFRRSNYLVYKVIGKLWPELLFQLPNSETTLLDQYSPFSKQLCKSIKSIDAVSEGDNRYSTVSATFVEIGFSSNVIKAGESITAKIVLKRGWTKRNVSFVLSAFGAVNFVTAASFKYQAAVDGILVAEGRFSEIYLSNKVVNCLVTNIQTEPVLEIKLIAHKACMKGVESAAVMRISNFICMTLEG